MRTKSQIKTDRFWMTGLHSLSLLGTGLFTGMGKPCLALSFLALVIIGSIRCDKLNNDLEYGRFANCVTDVGGQDEN